MNLQCPGDPISYGTPLRWRRIEDELLISGEIDESSSPRFAEALESLGPETAGPPGIDRQWLLDLRPTRLLAAAGVTILIRWLRSLEEGDAPPPQVRILPSDPVGWVLEVCRLSDTVAFCDVQHDLVAGTPA